ncbi:DegV family protein [Gilvimarinus sp. F26214L]|uniref:DegV family protein n=1 Tax=Gilvimarinus sp. DZF01 TaxID=3461371 RepID=UPI004045A988
MSSVIIVDSACDLPERVVNSRSVEVMPLNLIIDGQDVRDVFTTSERLRMIQEGAIDLKREVDTRPATRDQIVDFLVSRILPNYDFAIVQTVARSRSPQYEMWQEVNTAFAAQYRKYRNTDRPFTLRIMDSGAMFTGQGLMALNTIHLGQRGVSRRELLEGSKQITDHIQSYSAPVDLHYLRERARKKGDRTIGAFAALLGKALNISPVVFGGQNRTEAVGKVKGHKNAVAQMVGHAMRCIERGLQTPLISIAYAGPLEELENYPAVAELKEFAAQYGVKVVTSVHTLTATINMGPGTFSLAVAPADADYRLRIE